MSEELVGGRWVRRGLIHMWVSDKPRPKTPPPCISHNTERGWQWHREHGINWPLTPDDDCGCYAAHYAHAAFVAAMRQQGKRCVRCGGSFAGPHRDYCGRECATEGRKERDRAYSREYYYARQREAS